MKRTILIAIATSIAALLLLSVASGAQAAKAPHSYSFKSTSVY